MLRLGEFLTLILLTHAQTLKRLAAFFGEEEFLQLLEKAGDNEAPRTHPFALQPEWFESHSTPTGAGYAELEGAVLELNLPPVLEFHVWAYPFYRKLIESRFELSDVIRTRDPDAVKILVEEASLQARDWVRQLPIHPELSDQAERIALNPWIRFRAEALKKAGKHPVVSLAGQS